MSWAPKRGEPYIFKNPKLEEKYYQILKYLHVAVSMF
jgi:hypothetical protein